MDTATIPKVVKDQSLYRGKSADDQEKYEFYSKLRLGDFAKRDMTDATQGVIFAVPVPCCRRSSRMRYEFSLIDRLGIKRHPTVRPHHERRLRGDGPRDPAGHRRGRGARRQRACLPPDRRDRDQVRLARHLHRGDCSRTRRCSSPGSRRLWRGRWRCRRTPSCTPRWPRPVRWGSTWRPPTR